MATKYTGFLQSHHLQTALQGLQQLLADITADPITVSDTFLQKEDPDLAMLSQWVRKGTTSSTAFSATLDILTVIFTNTTLNVSNYAHSIIGSCVPDLLAALESTNPLVVTSTLNFLRAINARNDLVLYQKLALPFDKKMWCGTDPSAFKHSKNVQEEMARTENKQKVRTACIKFLLSYLNASHDDVTEYAIKLKGFMATLVRTLKDDTKADARLVMDALIKHVLRTHKLSRGEKVRVICQKEVLEGVLSACSVHKTEVIPFLKECVLRLSHGTQDQQENLSEENPTSIGFIILKELSPWSSLAHLHVMQHIFAVNPYCFEKYVPIVLWQVSHSKDSQTQFHRTNILLTLIRAYESPLPHDVTKHVASIGITRGGSSVYTPDRVRSLCLGGNVGQIITATRLLSLVDGSHEFEAILALEVIHLAIKRSLNALDHLQICHDTASSSSSDVTSWFEYRRACVAGLLDWLPSSNMISRKKRILTEFTSGDSAVIQRAGFFYERLCCVCMSFEKLQGNALYKYIGDLDVIQHVNPSTQKMMLRLITQSAAFPFYMSRLVSGEVIENFPFSLKEGKHLLARILTTMFNLKLASCESRVYAECSTVARAMEEPQHKEFLSAILGDMLAKVLSEEGLTLPDMDSNGGYPKKGILHAHGSEMLRIGKAKCTQDPMFGQVVRMLKVKDDAAFSSESIPQEEKNTKGNKQKGKRGREEPPADEDAAVVIDDVISEEADNVFGSDEEAYTLFRKSFKSTTKVYFPTSNERYQKYVSIAESVDLQDETTVIQTIQRLIGKGHALFKDAACVLWLRVLLCAMKTTAVDRSVIQILMSSITHNTQGNSQMGSKKELWSRAASILLANVLLEKDNANHHLTQWLCNIYTMTVNVCDLLVIHTFRSLPSNTPLTTKPSGFDWCPVSLQLLRLGGESESHVLDKVITSCGSRAVWNTLEHFETAFTLCSQCRDGIPKDFHVSKVASAKYTHVGKGKTPLLLDLRSVFPCLLNCLSYVQPKSLSSSSLLMSRGWISLVALGLSISNDEVRTTCTSILELFHKTLSSIPGKFIFQWLIQGLGNDRRIPSMSCAFFAMALPRLMNSTDSLNHLLWREVLQHKSIPVHTVFLTRHLTYHTSNGLRIFALQAIKTAAPLVNKLDSKSGGVEVLQHMGTQLLHTLTLPTTPQPVLLACWEALRACILKTSVVYDIFNRMCSLVTTLVTIGRTSLNSVIMGTNATTQAALLSFVASTSLLISIRETKLVEAEDASLITYLDSYFASTSGTIHGEVSQLSNEGTILRWMNCRLSTYGSTRVSASASVELSAGSKDFLGEFADA
eukprot:PhF_6_TR36345/c0_g1_i1/m.53274